MKIGCFALVEPFAAMRRQFEALQEMGIRYADVTDNHEGASLGVEFGFVGSISLASPPSLVRDLVAGTGIELTAFCAHANLLDPASPATYGTRQIIDAIKLAHLLGLPHVITTEGEPRTRFGHHLSPAERIFSIKEKLQTPLQWARDLGLELLLETHGPVTDTTDGMSALLHELNGEVGVCLDTGNSWLGGAAPLDYVRVFGRKIKHVHWKDMDARWEAKRGRQFGCGMSVVPLGTGVVGIAAIVQALRAVGFDGPTTLEVAGKDNVAASVRYLSQL